MIDYSKRVGETNIARNGLKMTIIAYRSCTDIDVEFEDGVITNTSYKMFKDGYVKNKNARNFTNRFKKARDKYLGMEVKTNWGICKVVEYNGTNNITVEFEDGSRKIVCSKSLNNGTIRRPSVNTDPKLLKNKSDRIGVESVNSKGIKAKIVEYNSSKDFTIEFEDGERVKYYKYSDFIRGKFSRSIIRTNEERIMNNGLKCKIINYESYKNITVQFENGIIRSNINYNNFKKGNVSFTVEHVGEKRLMNNGVEAEIIDFRNSLDISIKLEDDTILDSRQYSAFIRGGISHPTIANSNGKGSFECFKLFKRAYKYKDNVYYNCRCENCGLHDILTPHEMILHSRVCVK